MTELSDSDFLNILKSNQGFDHPEEWIEYARKHNFAKVPARRLYACPDCNSKVLKTVGQFVYYSQLIRIQKCRRCQLRFADVVIDLAIRVAHFKTAYRDDSYYESERRTVFEHITRLVHRLSPKGGSIIDVGGAQGHLALMLRQFNPEYELTVTDISIEACRKAKTHKNLDAVCLTVENLSEINRQYGVILMIDVIYYTEDINGAFESVLACLRPGGWLIMRIPNRLWWIEPAQALRKLIDDRDVSDRVLGVNPEHQFFLSRKYLRRKFKALGLDHLRFMPSPTGDRNGFLQKMTFTALFYFCRSIYYMTFGGCCLSPSQVVLARKRPTR